MSQQTATTYYACLWRSQNWDGTSITVNRERGMDPSGCCDGRALVSIFPGINFILLDSDCLPVALFEAADLWKEAYLTRFPSGTGKGLPLQHPLHRKREFANHPEVVYTQHRVNADRQRQGVLLVTEPHSELNAGLVVSSSHPPLFNWADWTRRCRRLPDTQFDSMLATAAEEVEQSFLVILTGFLQRTLTMQDLTPGEMQCWIQSGLVLSPLVATCTQYSVDFCLAWALIGEWTSRILFPVPKGPWPRHGHAGALLEEYQARSPRIVAWAIEPHLSKVHCLPYFSCRVLYLYLPYLETECFRPQDCVATNSDHLLCMPMAEPKLGWHKHYSQSRARDGSLWLLRWSAPLVAKNPCGQTLVCDRWLVPPWTLNFGPVPLSIRTWPCSYPVGNAGIMGRFQGVPSTPGSRM